MEESGQTSVRIKPEGCVHYKIFKKKKKERKKERKKEKKERDCLKKKKKKDWRCLTAQLAKEKKSPPPKKKKKKKIAIVWATFCNIWPPKTSAYFRSCSFECEICQALLKRFINGRFTWSTSGKHGKTCAGLDPGESEYLEYGVKSDNSNLPPGKLLQA